MSRQLPTLGEPPADGDLTKFPGWSLKVSFDLWRVVRAGRGPWWFGSSLAGRFDLPGPRGTCYLASDPLTALLELIGPEMADGGVVPEGSLANRRLRQLRVPEAKRLADAISRRAAKWVTAEIHTIVPYELPQLWAHAWDAVGFEGVRYFVRHDPSRDGFDVALFGAAGERRSWKRGREQVIDSTVQQDLLDRCGVRVVPRPSKHSLTFVDPARRSPRK